MGESLQNLIAHCPRFDLKGLTKKAGIPKRHDRKLPDFNNDASRKWFAMCEKLLSKMGAGCLIALIGKRGTGKTQAAVIAIVHSSKANRLGLYCKAMEIFLEIRATYTSPDRSELDAIQRFLNPRLLVIDEIQQRGDTAFEDRLLAYLIDKRYDAMNDTVLIGNLTEGDLRETLDTSITDRLRETGGVITCDWESFRVMNDPSEDR